MHWVPVGTCAVVLAVLGAIVSIIEFRGWRRWVLAAVFILLGVGEYISIGNADAAHDKEVSEQKQAIESLRAVIQANEIRNASDLAYMRANLEDEQKLNQEYAPAIKQLAQTSADYMRKQYETKIETDDELFTFANEVVKKIRDFSRKYRQAEDNLFNQWRTGSFPSTEPERSIQWQQQTQKELELSRARDSQFRSSILPDAIYARAELMRRKLPEPPMSPAQKSEVNMVLDEGMLAGPYPELQLADYLELMARPLSPK